MFDHHTATLLLINYGIGLGLLLLLGLGTLLWLLFGEQ